MSDGKTTLGPVGENSPEQPPFLAELADGPVKANRGLQGTLLGLGGLILTAAVMVLLILWPEERWKWRLAAAEEKRLNGDVAGALAEVDALLTQNPGNREIQLKRVQWLVESKDYRQALTAADALLTSPANDPQLLLLKVQILHYLGNHQTAVTVSQSILELDAAANQNFRSIALNGLAYARALANQEISEGLADVDEAMRLVGENEAMLDTRGFLYYRRGDWDRALSDLNQAVEITEARFRNKSYPSGNRRQKALEDQQLAQSLAVMRYHRGLVHRAQGNNELAEQDFQRVRMLGHEPNDSLF